MKGINLTDLSFVRHPFLERRDGFETKQQVL
jgi:hypothetical protein